MQKKKFTKSEVSDQVVPKIRDRKEAINVGIIGGAGYTGGELMPLSPKGE